MKKILISSVFIVLTICGLYAQDVKFGIRGGMNMAGMPTAKSSPVSDDYNMRIASGWGIFTELQVNPAVSLRLGVEYSGLGGKKNGVQAFSTQRLITEELSNNLGFMGIPSELEEVLEPLFLWATMNPYYAEVDNSIKFNYVKVPLLAQFGRDVGVSPWRVYVNAGPFVSFILASKQVAEGTSTRYSDATRQETLWVEFPTIAKFIVPNIIPDIEEKLSEPVDFSETNITGEMKSTNFGITGNIGIRYQRNKSFFFLEAGGNFGFFTVQESNANGSNRLGAISVMAGYSFSLF